MSSAIESSAPRCRKAEVNSKPDTHTSSPAMAVAVLRSTIQGVVTVSNYIREFGDIGLAGLVEKLDAQTQAVNEGSLARAEAMLRCRRIPRM